MHDNDQAMKTYVATLPVPEFENPAFNRPPPLQDARVAIVHDFHDHSQKMGNCRLCSTGACRKSQHDNLVWGFENGIIKQL